MGARKTNRPQGPLRPWYAIGLWNYIGRSNQSGAWKQRVEVYRANEPPKLELHRHPSYTTVTI